MSLLVVYGFDKVPSIFDNPECTGVYAPLLLMYGFVGERETSGGDGPPGRKIEGTRAGCDCMAWGNEGDLWFWVVGAALV